MAHVRHLKDNQPLFFSHFRVDGLKERQVKFNSCSANADGLVNAPGTPVEEHLKKGLRKHTKSNLGSRKRTLAKNKSKASAESIEEEGECWTEYFESREDKLIKRTVHFGSQVRIYWSQLGIIV
mgnify:CR=1 FL=1